MSINIDNVYCNHNLQSNSIKYTHDINFESFNYPKAHYFNIIPYKGYDTL